MPAYYAIIPANVRYDKDIPANAKLLYGEITALCNEKGFCWASNTYFSELYGVSPETVSRWVSRLQKAGYIFTNVSENQGNTRKIWIRSIPLDENVNTYPQKDQEGLDENVKHNTTVNNTSNTTTNKQPEKDLVLPFKGEVFLKVWNEWMEYRKKRKIPKYTDIGLKHFFKKLCVMSQMDENVAAQMLEQSMANGWQGVFELKNQSRVGKTNPVPTSSYLQSLEHSRSNYKIISQE